MNHVKFNDVDPNRFSKLARIFTGLKCNTRCKFCYYMSSDVKEYPQSEVITQLLTAKTFGMTGVEFSGGESSIDPNFISYITYAKRLGFERVSTVTNGIWFADIDNVKLAKDAGLSDVLISLHGYDKESYHRNTGCNTFSSIDTAIRNFKTVGMNVRCNVTVTNDVLPDDGIHILNYVSSLGNVTDLNFILFNNFVDAVGGMYDIDKITKFVSNLGECVYNYDILTKLRYFPLCIVGKCLPINYNYIDQLYDTVDWHVATNIINNIPSDENAVSVINDTRDLYYVKYGKCNDCIHNEVCDGVKHGWLESEVTPCKN